MSRRSTKEMIQLLESLSQGDQRFSITPTGISPTGVIEYDFHCRDCGGYIISAEEPITRHSTAECRACGQQLGTLWAIEKRLRKQLKIAGVDVWSDTKFKTSD